VQVKADGQVRTARVQQEEREVAFPHSCGSDETKPDVTRRVMWDDAGGPD